MNLNKDLISIIVPVYNAEKYLEPCLDSILRQTYPKIEILLVDDGSIDNSRKICDEYKIKDDRVRVIHKKNEGVSVARNIGIEKAKGKYITFVDSDDWIEINAIETLYTSIIKEKCDVVRGLYTSESLNKKTEGINIEKINYNVINNLSNADLIKMALDCEYSCYVWLLLIKRDILIKENIRFDKKLFMYEDTAFYIDLLNNNRITFTKNNIYHYRQNIGSVMNNKKNQVKIMTNTMNLINHISERNNYDNFFYQKAVLLAIDQFFNDTYRYSPKEYKTNYLRIKNDNNLKKYYYKWEKVELPNATKITIYLFINNKYLGLVLFLKLRNLIHNIKLKKYTIQHYE